MRALFLIAVVAAALPVFPGTASEPIDIGSRLELFVDDFLVGQMKGDVRQQLHRPKPEEVVLVTDRPWEGNTCAYYTIFQDGDLYRMYYRGSHHDEKTKKTTHRQVACYAESRDGVRWNRPELGLFEWDGSKANNIVWDGPGTHNFTPFKDANPDCAADAKYKALAGGYQRGLWPFHSPDGIRWRRVSDDPVITRGAFDSQNLAFWDPTRKRYVDFHRTFRAGVRDIMTCTSRDFLNWTEPVVLEYPGAKSEHLYTNAIRPYERAPHILIGFPTRFLPNTQQVEPTFMASRDGRTFRRWAEALIPLTAPEDRDGNRSNYMANGLVQLPTNDREYAVYGTEAYYAGPNSRLRRFTYRVDGFVSMRGGPAGGELITKPLRFGGEQLVLNYQTREGGSVAVELLDTTGRPIKNYELDSCHKLTGDEIDTAVGWRAAKTLGELAGKPIQVRFVLRNADLYSIRFR